jgi:hypothetical protein
MTTKLSIALLACFCALGSISPGRPPEPLLVAALQDANDDGHPTSITDLKAQLAGTQWKAESPSHIRPGLYAGLKFNHDTVEPAGYRYEVDSHDFTVRIFFNHGDTQLLLLTDSGRRLSFTFQGKDYSYALTSR